jgi:hypothetical protein
MQFICVGCAHALPHEHWGVLQEVGACDQVTYAVEAWGVLQADSYTQHSVQGPIPPNNGFGV